MGHRSSVVPMEGHAAPGLDSPYMTALREVHYSPQVVDRICVALTQIEAREFLLQHNAPGNRNGLVMECWEEGKVTFKNPQGLVVRIVRCPRLAGDSEAVLD